jgi:hypothetical protein
VDIELSKCDYCIKLTQHMKILLYELNRNNKEATLQELKCYYWLSTFFKGFLDQCTCLYMKCFEDSIFAIQTVLDDNHIELNEEMKNCDICKILPCQIFSLLDVACRIENQESMNSMYEELKYHVFLSMLYEENNDKCTKCDHFVEYLSNLETTCEFLESKDISKLQQYVYYWKLSTNSDEIINQVDLLDINYHFNSNEIKINDKTAIYLDFNVYGKYENDPKVKSYLDEIVKEDNLSIFCSPVHLEETLRMNNEEYEIKRLDSLKKLTKGQSLVVEKEKIVFCVEDLSGRLESVKKYAKLNNFAEERNCIRSESREQLLIKHWNDTLSKYIGTATFDEIVNNLDSATGKKININLPDESDINNILSYVGSSSKSIREYHGLLKNKNLTFYTISTAIDSISSLFNVLGFRADKVVRKNDSLAKYPIYHKDNYRTIRSGYYDNNHLSFATECKYFVTTDRKLYAKSKELYGFIGCDTISIMLEDFMKLVLIDNA